MSGIFTSPVGMTDVCVKAPAPPVGCGYTFGYVEQDTDGGSGYAIDYLEFHARISAEAKAALESAGLWSNRADFAVTINGVAGKLANSFSPMPSHISSWGIGTLVSSGCAPSRDCYLPVAFSIWLSSGCEAGEGQFTFYVKADGQTLIHQDYGALNGMAFSPLRVTLVRISTSETLLDLTFSLAGGDGAADDWCAPTSNTGGDWTITVHSGSVCVAAGADWINLA